jgi:hypothetical protein
MNPTQKKGCFGCVGCLGLLIASVALVASCDQWSKQNQPARAVADGALQAKRKQLLEDFQRQGFVAKYSADENGPEMYVTPAFRQQDLTRQRFMASVLHAYHFQLPAAYHPDPFDARNSSEVTWIYDAETGKEIGAFHLGPDSLPSD